MNKFRVIFIIILMAFLLTNFGCVEETIVNSEIVVKQNGNPVQSIIGDYDFGVVGMDDTTQAISFTIENTGDDPLELIGSPIVKIMGDDADQFTITQPTKTVIEKGSSTEFSITFHPTKVNSKIAVVSIDNNDIDNNPYRFNLYGSPGEPGIIIDQDGTTTKAKQDNMTSEIFLSIHHHRLSLLSQTTGIILWN